MSQALRTRPALPIVEGHVALMPDAHVGIGATVGSVIPTRGRHPRGGRRRHRLRHDRRRARRHRGAAARRPRAAAAAHRAGRPGRRRPGPRRARRDAGPTWMAAHRPATDLAADQARRPPAVRLARLGQPLLRGVPRRAGPGLGRAPLRVSRGIGNQLAQAHIAKAPSGWPRSCSRRSRTPTWPTSSRARRSSTPTSPTCCGRRTTPGPTATR